MATAPVPPDWYEDPFVNGQERYWDGRQWTEGTRSRPAGHRRVTDWAVFAVVVVGAIGILALTERPSWFLGLALLLGLGACTLAMFWRPSRE